MVIGRLIPEVVAHRALTDPHGRAYTFLDDHGDEVAMVTYAELHRRAVHVAAELARTARPGDRALVMFGQSPDFVVGYLGCLYSGVLAVPVAPPRRGGASILASIVADCAPSAVLTDAAVRDAVMRDAGAGTIDAACGPLTWIVVDELPECSGEAVMQPMSRSADDIAFLQYTSGSTSDPKGVMVTHGNLAANQEMIRDAFGHDERSTVVGWAPFFHDQGLIGNLLQPLYVGSTAILMSPGAFIRRPMLWLSTIAKYRAHTSGGPNFAFDACVARSHSADLAGLDLSSWTIAFNGAEPIRPETLRRFADTFAPYGFREDALYPCYGLAEATLLVSASSPGRGPRLLRVGAEGLHANTIHRSGEPDATTLVGSGTVVGATDVAIVDPDTGTRVAAEGIGEICVSGPQVARGYWNRPEETLRDFGAAVDGSTCQTWLRTGDLGAVVDGELYVVGRTKDMVIIRGRNFYPHDIEYTAARAHRSIRPGGCAAFAVSENDGERLVIVAEMDTNPGDDDPSAVAGAIRGAVTATHQVSANDVVVTTAGALDKTTSGKIRRSAARHRYLHNDFPAVVS